jgi:hypothetical protein
MTGGVPWSAYLNPRSGLDRVMEKWPGNHPACLCVQPPRESENKGPFLGI